MQAPMYRPDSLTADSAFEEVLNNEESARILGSLHVAGSMQASSLLLQGTLLSIVAVQGLANRVSSKCSMLSDHDAGRS